MNISTFEHKYNVGDRVKDLNTDEVGTITSIEPYIRGDLSIISYRVNFERSSPKAVYEERLILFPLRKEDVIARIIIKGKQICYDQPNWSLSGELKSLIDLYENMED